MVSVTAKGRCLREHAPTRALPHSASPRPARRRRETAAPQHLDGVGESDRKREHGKREHAAEEGGTAPVAVADDSADEPADHHAERTVGQRSDEVASRTAPLLDQRGTAFGSS